MLKDALKVDENDLQALSRLGILKSRMGRPNEALEPLEKVLDAEPAAVRRAGRVRASCSSAAIRRTAGGASAR